jgi:hypothetical protein
MAPNQSFKMNHSTVGILKDWFEIVAQAYKAKSFSALPSPLLPTINYQLPSVICHHFPGCTMPPPFEHLEEKYTIPINRKAVQTFA